MARALQTTVIDLTLGEAELALRAGTSVGDLTRSPARTSLEWQLLAHARLQGSSAFGASWPTRAPQEFMAARATLVDDDGAYPVDATERWCRTPSLVAAGVRAWQALELFFDEPLNAQGDASGATVRFRAWDGTTAKWWNGSAWATATTSSHWNTAADLQAHVATLSVATRTFAVVAKLATTDAGYTPSFFGARLAYGCREIGDLDDALTRTVLASLRDEVDHVTGVAEVTVTAGDALELGGEVLYDVTEVQAVFDLTADALEAAPLAGTFAAGDVDANPPEPATWTPTVAFTTGHVIRCEFGYRPHVVVSQHRDVEVIERLPAVYLSPEGSPVRLASQGEVLIRDLYADPPVALAMPAGDLHTQRLEIRVIAEYANDVHRISRALRAWFGGQGGRTLVSPETGRTVHVRELEPLQTTTGLLAQGVQEARGTWALTHRATGLDTTSSRSLVADGGLIFTSGA